MEWILIYVAAGMIGLSEPLVIRDLTYEQCQAMVIDLSTVKTFAACYADDGRVTKVKQD